MLSTSCGSSGSVVLIWAARVATRGKRVSERSNRASHGPRPHRAAERPSLSSSSLLLQSLLWASNAAALRLTERCPATWASPPALPAAARAMSGCSAARWGRSSVLQQAAQELDVEAVAVLRPAPDVVRGALHRRELDRRYIDDRQLCTNERGVNFLFPGRRLDFRFSDRSCLLGSANQIAWYLEKEKEGFNTSFGKDTYIAVESGMLRKAHEVRVRVPNMCVVCRRNQNASTTIKSGAALVSNEKLWCGMNTENVPLIRVLEPASCPWKNCQGLRRGTGHSLHEPLLGRPVQIRTTSP